ncbi:hypothetical protein [Gemmiger sp.]
MKKTSFLKKLTAMSATPAMTCVMAVGAFVSDRFLSVLLKLPRLRKIPGRVLPTLL